MSASSLKLYTFPTPNGQSISVFLEELKAAYGGPEYEVVKMSLADSDKGVKHNHVKNDWFLKINPNGRIPAITHNGFNVFETSAILTYLAQVFDKDNKFSADVTDIKGHSEDMQWLFFAHGGIGPMLGQAGHFLMHCPEDIPYAKKRYQDEATRLYGVLEIRLTGREYLSGGPAPGKYGIADIKTFPWITAAVKRLNPSVLDALPNVKAWVERIEARPAVKVGLTVATTETVV